MARKRKKHRKATQGAGGAEKRFLRPTGEREAHNDTISAGVARRIVPPIDTLYKRGKLTDAQFAALAYYRDQANLANRSPVKDSCDFSIGGGDGGPGVAITSAMLETSKMEHKLGSLCGIAQAVARDDWTLTRWCIEQHGGRERYDSKGRFVAMVPRREKEVMRDALRDLRKAAGKIEIGA